ncbi:hypothetical protein AAFF_G00268310 [Aldrovandia affinis]|uniref:Uncharacterized protein n=1 Tax=Aldrovandia affinis TaxID=143900 RepID=A0AAD7WSN0_9TELE|nr:hypothetical protein AAFF_G00268310 [Aldrovandia affinis]
MLAACPLSSAPTPLAGRTHRERLKELLHRREAFPSPRHLNYLDLTSADVSAVHQQTGGGWEQQVEAEGGRVSPLGSTAVPGCSSILSSELELRVFQLKGVLGFAPPALPGRDRG